MKFILRSFLCGCLLATVAHCVELEVNPELKKKLSLWLESRLRQDLHSVSVQQISQSENLVRPEDFRETLLPHSSSHTSARSKRSKSSSSQSRRNGCSLGTCIVHDLPDRLNNLNNRLKTGSAPLQKISPHGYGRRRRSLPDYRVSLRMDKGKIRPVWSQTNSQVHKLEALLRRT